MKNKLQLLEITPDARCVLDSGRIIFDGTPSHPTLEGPKLYKRDGEYLPPLPGAGTPVEGIPGKRRPGL